MPSYTKLKSFNISLSQGYNLVYTEKFLVKKYNMFMVEKLTNFTGQAALDVNGSNVSDYYLSPFVKVNVFENWRLYVRPVYSCVINQTGLTLNTSYSSPGTYRLTSSIYFNSLISSSFKTIYVMSIKISNCILNGLFVDCILFKR